MSTSTRAPNDQAAADMELARNRTRLNVPVVRDYLYGERHNFVGEVHTLTMMWAGGRSGWEMHKNIAEAMRSDPVFEKEERYVVL